MTTDTERLEFSVLPGETDPDFLRRACEHWFTATPNAEVSRDEL